MKKTLLALSSVVLLVACEQREHHKPGIDQKKQEQTNQYQPGRRDASASQSVNLNDQNETDADRTITQNVRRALAADDTLSSQAKNVKVHTVDGVVTLRGVVNTEKDKEDFETKVSQISGVTRVDNQLDVKAS